jgi:hypothetical protein
VKKGKGLTHAHGTLKFPFSMRYLQKKKALQKALGSGGGGVGILLKQSAYSSTMITSTYEYTHTHTHFFFISSGFFVNKFICFGLISFCLVFFIILLLG